MITKRKAPGDQARGNRNTKCSLNYTPLFDDVCDILFKVYQLHGRDTCQNLLIEFGVRKVYKLKPAQFTDFIAACREKLQ